MTIEIRMNYYTHGNERVCIAGDMFQGQKWEPHQMKPVNGCAEDGWWCAKFDVPESCSELNYKFVVLRDNGNNRWEECCNREVPVDVHKPCLLSFTDYWAYPLESKLAVSEQAEKVEKKPEPVVEKKPEPVVEKKPEPVVEKKPEPVVEKKPEPVVEKKVEKKPEPVVEKKPESVVEKKVEKKAEPVVEKKVEKKAEPVVEKKAEPVVEKKPEPVAEKKVEKKAEPVVEKKPEPAAEGKLSSSSSSSSERNSKRRSFRVVPDEEPKRETVTLKHVEPKPEPQQPKVKHQKSGSIVEDCKKVFEPDGTPVEVPQFLRNSLKGSNSSSKKLAKYK